MVTCLRKLALANAPLVLNTPHLRFTGVQDCKRVLEAHHGGAL